MDTQGQMGFIVTSIILIVVIGGIIYVVSDDTALEDPAFFCLDSDRNASACTLEYAPVCGWSTQNISLDTYSNRCFACLDESVDFVTNGPCLTDDDR